MKTIKISVEYRGKQYTSKEDTISEEYLEEIKSKMQTIVKSGADYLVIETNKGIHYFGKDVVKECIVTLLIH